MNRPNFAARVSALPPSRPTLPLVSLLSCVLASISMLESAWAKEKDKESPACPAVTEERVTADDVDPGKDAVQAIIPGAEVRSSLQPPGSPSCDCGKTGGKAFLEGLPNSDAGREQKIFDTVKSNGFRPIKWIKITRKLNGRKIEFFVAADALQIGTPTDSVRVPVTPELAQKIATEKGWILPTTRMADLIHASAGIAPTAGTTDEKTACHGATPAGFSVAQTLAHDVCVDRFVAKSKEESLKACTPAARDACPPNGLIDNVGKDWVLTKRLVNTDSKSLWKYPNYGFYSSAGTKRSGPEKNGEYSVHQNLAFVHHPHWFDYSQVLRPINQICYVDGRKTNLKDVLKSDDACLVSDEGKLSATELPFSHELNTRSR